MTRLEHLTQLREGMTPANDNPQLMLHTVTSEQLALALDMAMQNAQAAKSHWGFEVIKGDKE